MKNSLLTFSLAAAFTAAFALSPASAQTPPAPPTAPHAPVAPSAPPIAEGTGHTISNQIGHIINDEISRAMNIQADGNYLGISVENLTNEARTKRNLASNITGVVVGRVVEDSPAARAGLRTGDVIIRIDNEAVTSTSKLTRLIEEAAPESSLQLTINRAGAEQQLTVTLGRSSRNRPQMSQLYADSLRAVPAPNRAEIERNLNQLRGQQGALAPVFFGGTRRLGISTVPLTQQLAAYFDVKTGRGLLITNVTENSPAARAGLKAGDVVIEIGDAEIGSTTDFTRELNRKQEGEVELRVVRSGRERTIKATPERGRDFSFNFEEFAPEGFFKDGVGLAPKITPPTPPRPVLAAPRTDRIL